MFEIVNKKKLNPTVTLIDVYAPLIAKKAKPGQFIILRVSSVGERIPFTIASTDIEKGLVTVIYQIVGASTKRLDQLNEGDKLEDFIGPLGKPSNLEGLKKVAIIGGGAGSAIAYPIAKALRQKGCDVTSICGFRNKDLVILEDEFENVSSRFIKMSDDGSWGNKGLVTDALEKEILAGNNYDEVFAIGPLIMMKFVCLLTKKYNIKTTVSMNPIMIDGTGMCGCCRIVVDGKMKFACIDGPDFDGHLVDFDNAMMRNRMYKEWEKHQYEDTCNLLNKEIKDE
jgi:ferredoxin--NADP+ reductase